MIAQLVDFDDDILFLVTSLLKKQRQPSQMLLEMLPFVASVHARNNFIMGRPMLETLSLFRLKHLAFLKEQVDSVFKVAQQSINPPIPQSNLDGIGYQTEGCLLIQCLLLNTSLE
jgi:hypothetical protein